MSLLVLLSRHFAQTPPPPHASWLPFSLAPSPQPLPSSFLQPKILLNQRHSHRETGVLCHDHIDRTMAL